MPQILVLSDDSKFIEQIQKIAGYEVVIANDESQLHENNRVFFAIFVDIATLINPQKVVFQLILQRCRVVIVIKAEDSHLAAEYLNQGARDFLTKPAHPSLIQKRLEMLQELVRAKEKLHVGIHDAKQPLATILGYASLLKNPDRFVKIPQEMRQNMFESIHNGAVRLRDLLDQFDGFGI